MSPLPHPFIFALLLGWSKLNDTLSIKCQSMRRLLWCTLKYQNHYYQPLKFVDCTQGQDTLLVDGEKVKEDIRPGNTIQFGAGIYRTRDGEHYYITHGVQSSGNGTRDSITLALFIYNYNFNESNYSEKSSLKPRVSMSGSVLMGVGERER